MLPPPAYTSHASKKFRQWLPQNCCVYQSTRFNRRFFFLEHAGELRIFILRGEKGVGPNYRVQLLSLDQREGCRNMLELLQKERHQDLTISHLSPYTCSTNLPGSKAARPLAPENLHNSDSSLKVWRARYRFGDIPSKKQAFLCFHKIQAPRIQRELKPFPCCLCFFFQDLFHHSAKEATLWLGAR